MKNKLGGRIKELREKNDWSLRELESRVNINYSVLSRIESGKRPVTDSELLKFADIFDVSIDYLVGRSDDPGYKNIDDNKIESDPDLQIAFHAASDFSEEARKQTIDFINYIREKEKKSGRTFKKNKDRNK
ncbi:MULTISPECIES: helix-turn-helix domain-containing protein [Bacillus]|mgnify:CR=1 FL=1|uniref:helix-turn-helix domain-containing protein n=1 Tax=Bacillus TaxID=1386 RepID=UPI000DCCBE31|nr:MULTISPECIES: helix-turn-helix transcriptional regulator [Bacillus]MCL7873850.1 helix-turn-helix domain-containing protein [Bacillus altitudinis]MCY7692191.1 helix-turn-helix domain-containing protein [Bacillus altitudinis]MDH3097126.1 helix-turn-helix transcriptional regulator [Bacillus safensis]MDT1122088.1 helix-turn-helix transcriptional regulator [Bacillus altitudinis]RAU57389.1 transcriptional regulator [Bacillus safensis]